jgi:hypothetical protein
VLGKSLVHIAFFGYITIFDVQRYTKKVI